jgi:hypothetical protein
MLTRLGGGVVLGRVTGSHVREYAEGVHNDRLGGRFVMVRM